jgi:prevent-host-death family protein
MTDIGSSAARSHFYQLLARVARGEQIIITKRGKPVAMLVPFPAEVRTDVKEVVKAMLDFRDKKGPTMGEDVAIRDLVEAGRRY